MKIHRAQTRRKLALTKILQKLRKTTTPLYISKITRCVCITNSMLKFAFIFNIWCELNKEINLCSALKNIFITFTFTFTFVINSYTFKRKTDIAFVLIRNNPFWCFWQFLLNISLPEVWIQTGAQNVCIKRMLKYWLMEFPFGFFTNSQKYLRESIEHHYIRNLKSQSCKQMSC